MSLDIEQIKARVQMARPGPWVFREGTSVKGSIVGNGWHVDLISDDYEAWASVDFIAHSRTDIPALIEEIERLKASLDQANKRIVELVGQKWALKAQP